MLTFLLGGVEAEITVYQPQQLAVSTVGAPTWDLGLTMSDVGEVNYKCGHAGRTTVDKSWCLQLPLMEQPKTLPPKTLPPQTLTQLVARRQAAETIEGICGTCHPTTKDAPAQLCQKTLRVKQWPSDKLAVHLLRLRREGSRIDDEVAIQTAYAPNEFAPGAPGLRPRVRYLRRGAVPSARGARGQLARGRRAARNRLRGYAARRCPRHHVQALCSVCFRAAGA
jgi:hypothetical protein